MWLAHSWDQFSAIKQIELKFLLSFVVTLNLATDFSSGRWAENTYRRKKMLATRWRDKSPNNFIFIAQRFVDCYILARTKAEHCTAVLQFCLCCRCKLMVHLQQEWPAINLNLNGAPASMRGQNAGRCFLAFHIFHTPSTGFPSAFCYLPATCCFLLPPFFGSAHL